jgi:preprotein translocase subunit Sss1
LDPEHERKHPWLALIGIAAIGVVGLVLMVILTP